ncbi:MAG: tetratricopeptide repeat protein, partial [Myxococcota bacterium]
RGCFSDLNIVLTGRTNKYVAGMDAVYVGGGVWIVKAMMRNPGSDLRVVIDKGNLIIDVVKSDKEAPELDEELPTVQALVNGTAPSSKANTQFPPLMFLHGDALSYAMTSEDFIPMLPAPAALPRSSWHAIDRARQSMLSAKSEVALAQARYELGWLYLEKGFDREARYYFNYLADSPGALSARDVALARARAALACQDWEEARERLREAYRFGARESVVVEGFGVISLATGVPGRSLTANVLARVTGRPEALLLAAELLQRDGYYKESRPLLEALTGRVSGKTGRRVALRLGDARMLDGEMDAAVRAYRKGPGAVRGLSAFRMTLVDLLEKGPTEWAAVVPKMATLAKQSGEVGAEALYLLAQLDRTMGSQVDAVSDLSKLLRDHRRIAQRSDAPELMWDMYKERQRVLLDAERWFDVAALHEGAWHPMVRRAVDDPELLIRVADAYEAVGLPHRALYLVREVFPMLLKIEGNDSHLVYRLARLYGETNNSREGLKTLKYLRSRGIPPDQRAEVAMLAANLKEIAGDAEGATLELRQAVRSEKYRDEATVWLARMDAEAGRCKQATSVLWSKLMGKRGQATFKTSRPYLALARCLTASGEGEMAAEAAKLAAARSDSPEESRYASYIAASAEAFPGDSNQDQLQEGSDIWAALSADHERAEQLESEINQRKVPTEY